MKKLLCICFGLFLLATDSLVKAIVPGNVNNVKNYFLQDNDKKVKISEASLPQAVKDTLAGPVYKDWKIADVYKVKGDIVYYQVEFKKAGDIWIVNFAENGGRPQPIANNDSNKMKKK
jgi:hypothetical protein